MTVLTNGAPVVHRGSVLSAYLPKPRVKADNRGRAAASARERVSLRERLRGRAGAIKDFVVTTVAFGFGVTAAFQWHPWAGFLSIGISLFLIDHAVDRGEVADVGTP